MKSTFLALLLHFLLLVSATVSIATRLGPDASAQELKASRKGGGSHDDYGMGGVFGQPGGGFDVPGFGPVDGGGYGSGYGGPSGGRSKSGTINKHVVCKHRGPCYKKKLTCPAKCFTSYAGSGRGYGYGGGGGGCNFDCEKNCIAHC